MLGETEGGEKGGGPTMRWTNSKKEAVGMTLQKLGRAVETGHGGHHSFVGLPGVRANPQSLNTVSSTCGCLVVGVGRT